MDKQKLKEFTGLDTWLEFYEFIQRHRDRTGATRDTFFVMKPPPPRPGTTNAPRRVEDTEEWNLDIKDVKAAAFDEIYQKLPTVDQLHAALKIGYHRGDLSFFEKIPTRN